MESLRRIGQLISYIPMRGTPVSSAIAVAPERKAAVVIGYEHPPPHISLEPLLAAFEVIAGNVMGLNLGERVKAIRQKLAHPVHQQVTVTAWEVLV
jgi:hypothetical protein